MQGRAVVPYPAQRRTVQASYLTNNPIEAKNELCTYQKDQLKGELIMYHQVLETNPELLEHIQDIEII